MNVMILAAGFGRRLGPLTDVAPKALLEVGGMPLLAILLAKVRASGAPGVVVNVHHHAGLVESFLRDGPWPEEWIRISREEEILGTGGGVRYASGLLGGNEPVLVHNVDVLTNLPFRRLAEAREGANASVILAVAERRTGRPLAVDDEGSLCGRWGSPPVCALRGKLRPVAFQGISMIGEGVAGRLEGEGSFNLVDAYLRLASRGEKVTVFPMDDWYWADAGTPERLARIEGEIGAGRVSLESLSR